MRAAAAGGPRARLLRWLARRARSEREIRDRLAQWGTEPDLIDELVKEFTRRGLIDDRALAEQICDWHRRHDPVGPRRLRVLLLRRGLDPACAEAALAPGLDLDDQRELVERLVAKRLPGLQSLAPATRARRLVDYLRRRGFDDSLLREVQFSLMTDSADPEEFEVR
jgi:regulatory protein